MGENATSLPLKGVSGAYSRVFSFKAPITMSISINGGEAYAGRGFSVSQLLYAAKNNLQGTGFGGGFVFTL